MTRHDVDSVTVSWAAPSRAGSSPVRQYRLWLRTPAEEWPEQPLFTLPASTRSQVVDGLSMGSRYYVRVAAVNDAGSNVVDNASGSSNFIGFEVEGVNIIPGFDWMDITWPGVPDGAASFVVQWKPDTEVGWDSATQVISPAGTTSHNVGGLSTDAGYTARVTAKDSQDNVLWTDSASARLGSIAPFPDRDIRFLDGWHTDMMVFWRGRASSSAPLETYRLEWRRTDTNPVEVYEATRRRDYSARGGQPSFSHLLKDLVEDAEYAVRVSLLDNRGRVVGILEESARTLTPAEYVETRVFPDIQQGRPWLAQAWDVEIPIVANLSFVSSPQVALYSFKYVSVDAGSGASWPNLVEGTRIVFGSPFRQRSFLPHFLVASHEIAHHFTIDYRVPAHAESVAVGWIYLHELIGNSCNLVEVYADALAFYAVKGKKIISDADEEYYRLGFVYLPPCSRIAYPLQGDTLAVIGSVNDGETPQWLYDTYSTDGTQENMDLDRLWATVEGHPYASWVAYGLRDSFGGYCSHQEAIDALGDNEAAFKNPWMDGGCQTRQPRAMTAASGSSAGSIVVTWQAPFYATTPTIDRYLVQWKSGTQEYSTDRQEVVSDLSNLSFTISGLTTGTEYTVRVAAVNQTDTAALTDDDGHSRAAETTATAG